MKRKIHCFCENSFDHDVPEVYDLDKDSGILKTVLDGTFMSIKCTLCGKILKPEFPCKVLYQKKEIAFIPEQDRLSYKRKKLKYEIGSPYRVTIGYRELVEKLLCMQKDLNDQVIELMKFHLLSRLEEGAPEEADINVFLGDVSGEIQFYIEGIKKDELGVYKAPKTQYEELSGELLKKLKDEQFASFLSPPYVSLNSLFME